MFKPVFVTLHVDVRKIHHSVCDTKRETSLRIYDEYGELVLMCLIVIELYIIVY